MSTSTKTPFALSQSATGSLAAKPSLGERLSSLHLLAQRSAYVFTSPLDPIGQPGAQVCLPRFVYFGPGTHDASLRLALYAGFSSAEKPATEALLSFVEQLILAPDIGQSLQLSFFPIVDGLGLLAGQEDRQLAEESWLSPRHPDLRLLQQDIRLADYQGFIRIGLSNETDEIEAAFASAPWHDEGQASVDFITSDEFTPLPVRFVGTEDNLANQRGPVELSPDLSQSPFELRLTFPASWPQVRLEAAVALILKRFILRHRALVAYAQHL